MKLYKSKKDPELFYYYNIKNEKLWCYRHKYYDALGKRKEKYKQGFKKENEAYRALLEVKTSILNGDTKQVEHANITVSEWLDIWYETHKNDWKEPTRQHRERVIRMHIKPLLGKCKLLNLDKSTYKREFIDKLLQDGIKPSTVQLLHRIFKAAINATVEDEILPKNRFKSVTIPDYEAEKENFLTPEELNLFLSESKKREKITNYTILTLLAYTGLRRGEAFGLQWQDVDFDLKTITVNRTRDRYGTRTPKSKKSRRTIRVDDVLIDQLNAYRKWCKELKFSLGMHLQDDDFIFITSGSGNLVSDYTLNQCVDRLCEAAKVNRITPHGLRHAHATILVGRRIPVRTIADRLGNTPQMIYNIYGHSFDQLESESVAAFTDSLTTANK